jgi:rfaE bifunctional protein kinase chain/domain
MTRERLGAILDSVGNVRAGVLGDICLDVYWLADMTRSELSRENPHYPLPVVKERFSPGGGGNVASNMAALRPAKVFAAGVAGDDWRRAGLLGVLRDIDVSHIHTVPGMVTNTFCKPFRAGISDTVYEDPRLDFLNHTPLSGQTEDLLIGSLDALASEIDVLCVSDQLPFGAVTGRVREHIIKLAAGGLTVIADSRDRIGLFTGCIIKPNEVEGARAAGVDRPAEAARILSAGREVILTAGAAGSFYASGGNVTHIPARAAAGKIDIAGAGDTFLSGFALALAAGASRPEAAYIAGLCSEVTIQKIGTTGTASAEEVLDRYDSTR